jgi:hypothetical protein
MNFEKRGDEREKFLLSKTGKKHNLVKKIIKKQAHRKGVQVSLARSVLR